MELRCALNIFGPDDDEHVFEYAATGILEQKDSERTVEVRYEGCKQGEEK